MNTKELKPDPLPSPEYFTETAPPATRRRIHWIVPAAVSVIVILSLIFYVRIFCQREDNRQSAVGSQQQEVNNRPSTIDHRQSAVVTPLPDSLPQIGGGTGWGSDSALKTVAEGKHLFKLAREVYGNPYLWVLIYKANITIITDPDQVITGKELEIPSLEGAPHKLSRNDSLEVSEGYRLVYEYYKAQGDSRAEDFKRAMVKYRPL